MKQASGGAHIGPWLPHLGTPLGLLGFWLMHRADLLGPAPYWLIVVLLGVTGVCNAGAYVISSRMAPGPARMHLRLAVAALSTTVILYATGWGPVIAIGYVLGVSDVLRSDGSQAWWRGTAWCLGAVALGQVAISIGLAPSVLALHVSHAVAVGNAVCLVIVMYSLGTTTAATEAAKDAVATEREHFRSLVQHASDVIVVLDRAGLTISYISPAVLPLLGYTPEECIGMSIFELIGVARTDEPVLTGPLDESATTQRMQLRHRDGSPRMVEVAAGWRDDGTIVGNIHDVTRQHALEHELRYKARHDPLTGLMNRAALIEAVEQHTVCSAADDTISVLFVDLDGFKEVNDALGHETGDAVLVEAARRIVGAVPAHAFAGRLGGDEFLVVLPATTNTQASVIAGGILAALHQPWPIPTCDVGASIGVATTGARRESAEDILRRADEAMYDAKRQGKGRYVLAQVS